MIFYILYKISYVNIKDSLNDNLNITYLIIILYNISVMVYDIKNSDIEC